MRIGIFGGTFNPIHWGHLLLAETARERLSLDRVLFVPARRPPHKRGGGLLKGEVRLVLIRLAIRHHPAFVASAIELKRPGVSYSIETVRAIRAAWPRATLYLLIGQDMLQVQWVGWDELKRLCTIVVARRPGVGGARRERSIQWLEMPAVDIASSDIRDRLRRGRSIRYLVPDPVERAIRRRRLYRSGGP